MTAPRVTVLDFGMGNLRSVAKALERAGANVFVGSELDPEADGLVVPGQGHFGSCVVNLGARLKEIASWIEEGRPYLGICLGLQILFERSQESAEPGIGVLPGEVVRFPDSLKVPHIGWNEVVPAAGSRLFEGIRPETLFYFVHSYYPSPSVAAVVAARTEYGEAFCCAVERDNVAATQFHPEKSGDAGHALLRNVVAMWSR